MTTKAATHLEPYEERIRRGGDQAVRELCRFFMRDDLVHQTLRKIAAKLNELKIPYAVAGGMALVAHGYLRGTVDVDILVTAEGLKRIHESLEGLGYVRPFEGSKNLRDTETSVRIEFLIAGGFPGDGKPKPVAFPDPSAASVEINGIRYVGLTRLIELKLASGLTGGVPRMKDFTDVVALIQELSLPKDFSAQLDPYVRGKYDELWQGIQDAPLPPVS